MNARFAATLVAFAAATAVVSHPHVLAELLVQLRDPNILGGALYAILLKTFGFAFVLAICGCLTGGTVLLVAWRTRTRGAPDAYAAFAAVLATSCLIPRLGVSLDPLGWICAAGFMLALDRTDRASIGDALPIVVIWAALQGGAPLAALLAVFAFAGALIDAKGFTPAVRLKATIAGGAIVLGALQLAAAPWHAYGPHALYLDALGAGAQRDRLWSGGFTVAALAFCAVVVFAAWYGVRRRGKTADALTFFGLMVLAMLDARNLPYFGIIAAPIVADAIASYYVDHRAFPIGSVAQYSLTFLSAAFAFVAVVTATEPKAIVWPQPSEQPARLLLSLSRDRRNHHYLLCQQPRWCDGAEAVFPNVTPILDDRAGIAGVRERRTEQDVVTAQGSWRSELRSEHVDAVIAQDDSNLVALLVSTGWRESKHEIGRVLLRPAGMR
ncbi:MAG TPA: hypothetical protein VFE17_04625 [Candidatus Baltobacteraceae bacterium]|jgi:hypothetical protein|nr:hypothetical protein [Candidatus Baltobacteraceae bacterium]